MGGGTIADWRHRNRHFLTGARLVIAPSQDTARRIADFAPGARVRAIPHTDMAAPDTPPPPTPKAKPLSAGAPLKIVVLGALSAIKGADLLEATSLEAARSNAPIEFHLLGYGYRHLQTQPRAHLTVHGSYEDEDLPDLLQWLQPDLVWFPAQWPETYSYTLSASLQAGLPVVAPDLGAFPERLAGRPWSWVVRWDMSAAECLHLFTTLREQHFATCQPPQSPSQTDNAAVSDWHYRIDYLAGIPNATQTEPLSIPFLTEHLRTPVSATSGAKSLLLSSVVHLRSHPLLRGVARRIPGSLQRSIKNWLQA